MDLGTRESMWIFSGDHNNGKDNDSNDFNDNIFTTVRSTNDTNPHYHTMETRGAAFRW